MGIHKKNENINYGIFKQLWIFSDKRIILLKEQNKHNFFNTVTFTNLLLLIFRLLWMKVQKAFYFDWNLSLSSSWKLVHVAVVSWSRMWFIINLLYSSLLSKIGWEKLSSAAICRIHIVVFQHTTQQCKCDFV